MGDPTPSGPICAKCPDQAKAYGQCVNDLFSSGPCGGRMEAVTDCLGDDKGKCWECLLEPPEAPDDDIDNPIAACEPCAKCADKIENFAQCMDNDEPPTYVQVSPSAVADGKTSVVA